MPMTELDLSTAIFLADPAGADPYGKYEPGVGILTNTGYPDFRFPGMVLDRSLDYDFEITIAEGGSEIAWMWAGDDDDFDASYNSPYEAFGYKLFNAFSPNNDPFGSVDNVFSFTVPATRWAARGIPAGWNTPFFETDANAVVTSIRWSGPDLGGGGGGGGGVAVSNFLSGRTAFAT